MTAALAVREKELLDSCERKIERGLATFVEVGRALAEIRDRRLYRETHGTFEAYCEERWNLSRPRAYELISAADVVSGMPDNEVPPPSNPRQANELARVPESKRTDVWREANERTNGKPTAAAIREVWEERQPSTDLPPPVAQPDPWSQEERDMRVDLENGGTVVVSLRGHHERIIRWAQQRGLYVRVDRATPWGNPFETPADGTRDLVIANYSEHYLRNKPSLLSRLHELKGKALACWCAPEPCHADVLRARADTC